MTPDQTRKSISALLMQQGIEGSHVVVLHRPRSAVHRR
ncbi:conserved hypothetical protein [Streptomyces viridosporus ATCC 14672]|uniref:Uncharacterized protein n=1 Tax=Streptomyces viridosporus (strain ATCC 14672 / DSM 40746 / JCM 4963 / KCTC 9882 / NRRL B-12104 / FH 1290) TaxID=566461 RepID=D6A7N2_STRV1|nr:conserved hypothetical protein [Streptomyces viridosporus ATCC 14672]